MFSYYYYYYYGDDGPFISKVPVTNRMVS